MSSRALDPGSRRETWPVSAAGASAGLCSRSCGSALGSGAADAASRGAEAADAAWVSVSALVSALAPAPTPAALACSRTSRKKFSRPCSSHVRTAWFLAPLIRRSISSTSSSVALGLAAIVFLSPVCGFCM
eukprot:Amastigsp_a513766_16.p2 type:complete len:131 gc:universal Amastigsp_a513766_16:418-26(-)